MKVKQAKYTIKDFDLEFPTEESCFNWVIKHVYPDGIYCPLCEKITKHYKDSKRKSLSCDLCGHHVHPTANTIFEKSSTPLRQWLYAMFIMSATRCGVSAKQLQRELGVTYKTAWRMFREIRKLFIENPTMFSGEIELDETYMGSRKPGKRGRGAAGKTPIFGIVQRKGNVRADVTDGLNVSTIYPIVKENIAINSTIFTDEYPVYDRIKVLGFKHERVNHNSKIYVLGNAHTNTIEGFWSLLKRGISGVYHAVSPKYLQSYVNEYAFRYNHRQDAKSMFKTVLEQI